MLDLTGPQLALVMGKLTVGLKTSTTATMICEVKSFYRFLQTMNLRPDNPSTALRVPKFPDTLAERITDHETVMRLAGVARTSLERLLVLTLYYGGLRAAEACSLRARDVRSSPDGIILQVVGKGRRAAPVLVAPAIGEPLLRLAQSLKPDDQLFRRRYLRTKTHGPERPLTPDRVWRIIKTLGESIGVPAISPHWLRHTHASVALEHKASLPEIQQSLRHKNIQTTMRYLHLKPTQSSSLYLPAITEQRKPNMKAIEEMTQA
jgi:integrase/recombinase XerD